MHRVSFFGHTDVGKVRDNNEDAFFVHNIWDDNHVLAVVIDGVGGNDGGEVAAEIAKKSIPDYLLKYPNGERIELLKQAVVFANNTILNERKEHHEYVNMSCVLTAVLLEIDKKRINMAHVGDTRLYQNTHDSFTKLSHDHSMVGYREEIGDLTEIEAMNHPQRNIITKDVGSELLDNHTDYVEIATFDLINNSSLMLCSDGLCDMITSAQMRDVLNEVISTDEKVTKLITAANDAGGRDNVTVVLLEYSADNENIHEEPKINGENVNDENEVPDIQDVNLYDTEENKHDGNNKIILCSIIFALLFFVIGFFVGGFFAKDILPDVFFVKETDSFDIVSDSVFIENDTLNNESVSNNTNDKQIDY